MDIKELKEAIKDLPDEQVVVVYNENTSDFNGVRNPKSETLNRSSGGLGRGLNDKGEKNDYFVLTESGIY